MMAKQLVYEIGEVTETRRNGQFPEIRAGGRWWIIDTKRPLLEQGIAMMVSTDTDIAFGGWTVSEVGDGREADIEASTNHPVVVAVARRMWGGGPAVPIPTFDEAVEELTNPPDDWEPVELPV